MPGQNVLDAVANDLAVWLDQESTRIAAAMAPQGTAPFAAQGLSETDKLEYYRAQLFNQDGTPNINGRSQQIQRLGPQGFTQVYKAVLKAYPQLKIPTPPPGSGMPPPAMPMPMGPPGMPTPRPPIGPIPAMAQGGVVTQPTLALIGEAGPEAVVPLTDPDTRADILRENGWTEDAISKIAPVPTTVSDYANPEAEADFRQSPEPLITMYRPNLQRDQGMTNRLGDYIDPADTYAHEAHHAYDAQDPTISAAINPNPVQGMAPGVLDDLNTLRQYAAVQHNPALYDAANAAMDATSNDPAHVNHYLAYAASLNGAPDWYLAKYYPYIAQSPTWGGAQAQSAQLPADSTRLQGQYIVPAEAQSAVWPPQAPVSKSGMTPEEEKAWWDQWYAQFQQQVAAGQIQPK